MGQESRSEDWGMWVQRGPVPCPGHIVPVSTGCSCWVWPVRIPPPKESLCLHPLPLGLRAPSTGWMPWRMPWTRDLGQSERAVMCLHVCTCGSAAWPGAAFPKLLCCVGTSLGSKHGTFLFDGDRDETQLHTPRAYTSPWVSISSLAPVCVRLR